MIIEFKNVNKTFATKNTVADACVDVNLGVEEGDIFGVVGYSGAGKSTLIRMVNALEKPESGEVVVNGLTINRLSGRVLRNARKSISMIFQQFNLLENNTVYENVAMPLILNHTPKAQIEKKVMEILEFVDLKDKVKEYPSKLSGGQKQRVGIARALTTDPTILLCDEPTSALDPKTTDSILQLLQKINRELNVTILIITHQINIVQKICNKVAVMEHGRVVEFDETRYVFEKPRQAITKAFVNTVIEQSIPETILTRARKETRNYKILRIRKLGDEIFEDINDRISEEYGLTAKTLFLSVNEMQGQVLTIVAVQVIGVEAKIKQVEDGLIKDNIQYEEVK